MTKLIPGRNIKMNTYIPSTQDIYMICFITMRGWRFEQPSWQKDGYKRELSYHEKESNDYYKRNDMKERFFGLDFDLETAYYRAVADDEKKIFP